MAIDIHLHVEYRKRKKGKKSHWVHSENTFINDRLYTLFSLLGRGGEYDPLFPLRGLPGDPTSVTYESYKQWKGGICENASWLTTQEFGECLDNYIKIVKEEIKDSDCEEWLKNYRLLYSCMKEAEDNGESARIIFWFDC